MKKVHITLTALTLIIQIGIIIAIFYFAQDLVILKTQTNNLINQTSDLEDRLSEFQDRNQQQILEISNSLISTQNDLTDQLNEIKADASSDFSGIIPQVIKGVVSIGTDVSQGSGFIISSDGYVITNAHVLSGARYARVLTYEANQWKPAQLIGYSNEMDIAILKIEGNYEYLEFGDSDSIQVGEKAIALGNPLGLSFSVSEGIISALDRTGPNKLPAYIQIDVPLNPGNSGGPLVDKRGKVIGINNFKLQNSENLGFALESNYAKNTINDILQNKSISLTV